MSQLYGFLYIYFICTKNHKQGS